MSVRATDRSSLRASWCQRLGRGVLSVSLMGLLAACGHIDNQPVPFGAAVDKTPCKALTFAGFPLLMPKPQLNNYFVCHQAYAMEFNVKAKNPLWVTEHLTAANLQMPKVKRFKDFRPDPLISTGVRSELRNFTRTGYDPGQMAPTADVDYSDGAVSQSYYFSNMVPQNRNNNRGVWAVLEKNVRDWALARGEVYVVTGPIYANGQPKAWVGQYETANHYYGKPSPEQIRRQQIAVPTHLFKIVLDPARGDAIAFIVPNEDVPVSALPQYAVAISTIEQATHLSFFPQLDPAQAARVKSGAGAANWPLVLGMSADEQKMNQTGPTQ